MQKRQIALVTGDGAAPEMMLQAGRIAIHAARRDNLQIEFVEAPMGWNAYHRFNDTTPPESMKIIKDLGTVFFGGVGDPALDSTLGFQFPKMKPESRALLALREEMGLLLNFRPMMLLKELAHLSPLRAELIPDGGIKTVFIRCLLQDSYFGTQNLRPHMPPEIAERLGIKLKAEVTGHEELVSEFSFYRKECLEKYFRGAFSYARKLGMPLISVDKENVMARYAFWRIIATRISKEFPDVPCKHVLVDAMNALLFSPASLQAVIACGNEQGDILSDGAAAAIGGMGLMQSSAINPETMAAMFESGAGTAPTLAGKDVANPLGRILTGALMLEHINALNGAFAIRTAVERALKDGYRTADIAEPGCAKILGCREMGDRVFHNIL